jgi:hypothetical protein
MLEEVFHLGEGRLFVEEFFALQGGQHPVQFLFRLFHHQAHEAERKLPADDSQVLQEGFLLRSQAVDAGGEDALHGQREMELGQGFCRRGGAETRPSSGSD